MHVTRLHISVTEKKDHLRVCGPPETFSDSDLKKLGERVKWEDGAYTITPLKGDEFVIPATGVDRQIGYVLESDTVARIGPFSLVLSVAPNRTDRIEVQIGHSHAELPKFPVLDPNLAGLNTRAVRDSRHQSGSTPCHTPHRTTGPSTGTH